MERYGNILIVTNNNNSNNKSTNKISIKVLTFYAPITSNTSYSLTSNKKYS